MEGLTFQLSSAEKLVLQLNLHDRQWYVYHLQGPDFEQIQLLYGPASRSDCLLFILGKLSEWGLQSPFDSVS